MYGRRLRRLARTVDQSTLRFRVLTVHRERDWDRYLALLIQKGHFKQARTLLERVPKTRRDPSWMAKLALASLAAGDVDVARSQVKQLASEQFTDASTWIRMAKASELVQDDELALSCWRSALSLELSSLSVLRCAVLLRRLSLLDEAIALLDSAIASGLDSPEVRQRLAITLDAAGNYERSEVQWRSVVLADPSNRVAVRALHRAVDRALMDFDRTVSITPGVNPLLRFQDSPEFEEHLSSMPSGSARPLWRQITMPVRLLTVSSNWNFMTELISSFESSTDWVVRSLDHSGVVRRTLTGESPNPPAYADELLEWADVIFVEWANDALIWTVQHAPPDTKIVVRLHSYELLRRWPMFANWTRVSDCIFVAEHNRQRLLEAIDIESFGCRTHVIPNMVDLTRFDLPKHSSADFTLGMAGYNSPNKQPLLAFDLLELLSEHDSGWTLRLAGHPWQSTQPPAFEEYASTFQRRASELCEKGALLIDPWTSDLPSWFQNIGIVLSCSEREGSHEAVREGLASGACGVVRNWPWALGYGGARASFPESFIFDEVAEAADHLTSLAESGAVLRKGERERKALLKREASEIVLRRIADVLTS